MFVQIDSFALSQDSNAVSFENRAVSFENRAVYFENKGSALLSSLMEEPMSDPTITTIPTSKITIKLNAAPVGRCRSRSHNIGGVASMARNKATTT